MKSYEIISKVWHQSDKIFWQQCVDIYYLFMYNYFINIFLNLMQPSIIDKHLAISNFFWVCPNLQAMAKHLFTYIFKIYATGIFGPPFLNCSICLPISVAKVNIKFSSFFLSPLTHMDTFDLPCLHT